ncbi:MAG: ParB N-terminal domain-containing protein [Nitrososphaerota archaeon]
MPENAYSADEAGVERDSADVIRELSGVLLILPIDLLRPHEGVEDELVDELAEEINKDGVIKKAILVDKRTLVVIDGHHRIMALRKLGCRKIPCLLVDYSSERIHVLSWSGGEPIPKSAVLRAGLEGKLMPPKTTKHIIRSRGQTFHASEIEPNLSIPLKDLL